MSVFSELDAGKLILPDRSACSGLAAGKLVSFSPYLFSTRQNDDKLVSDSPEHQKNVNYVQTVLQAAVVRTIGTNGRATTYT